MGSQKKLYILRHAKSSWDDPELSDLQRPLNKRGRRDASRMGERLAEKGLIPKQIISSPALRALSTANLLVKKLAEHGEFDPDSVQVNPKLYTFAVDDLIQLIPQLDDNCNDLMLIGHNPAMTELVNQLVVAHIENIPTCGLLLLEASAGSWKQFLRASIELLVFDFPRKSVGKNALKSRATAHLGPIDRYY